MVHPGFAPDVQDDHHVESGHEAVYAKVYWSASHIKGVTACRNSSQNVTAAELTGEAYSLGAKLASGDAMGCNRVRTRNAVGHKINVKSCFGIDHQMLRRSPMSRYSPTKRGDR